MVGRTFLLGVVFLLVTVCSGGHRIVRSAPPERSGDAVRIVPPEGEGTKYWSRWRGPSGQGLVKGAGYPDRWSETENVLWKVAVPGQGNSSPVLWGDQVFLTTSRDDGRRISILSYRRSDGELMWESSVPGGNPERIYRKNSHASATPSTDGERVYASFGSQGLVAVDTQGSLVWHRDLGDFQNYHGTAGSPVLYKDRIFLYQDHRGGSFVAAFDKLTGRTIWKTERNASVGWGTPIVIQVGDHDELIVSSQRRVNAYHPDTGEELWRCEGNLSEVIPTPVVGQGLVFCSSGRAGPTLAIRPGGRGDVTATHLVWQESRGSSFVPSALIYGDLLYMVNDMVSVVTCFEAATGKLMWQGRLGKPRREGFSASPVAVDGKVFFTNDGGETFVLEAGPEFKLLHVTGFNEPTLASPALLDGRWYFRTSRHLIAVGH